MHPGINFEYELDSEALHARALSKFLTAAE
jgi:hypothetical protein